MPTRGRSSAESWGSSRQKHRLNSLNSLNRVRIGDTIRVLFGHTMKAQRGSNSADNSDFYSSPVWNTHVRSGAPRGSAPDVFVAAPAAVATEATFAFRISTAAPAPAVFFAPCGDTHLAAGICDKGDDRRPGRPRASRPGRPATGEPPTGEPPRPAAAAGGE